MTRGWDPLVVARGREVRGPGVVDVPRVHPGVVAHLAVQVQLSLGLLVAVVIGVLDLTRRVGPARATRPSMVRLQCSG